MANLPNDRVRWTIVIVAAAVLVASGLFGGADNGVDVRAIHALAAIRATHPPITEIALAITTAGGAPGTMAILVVALIALALARHWRTMAILGGVVLSGRLAVEGIKLVAGRQRPHFEPWPVRVDSLSFPSGHAANSMITMLAIALIAVPPRRRGAAVPIAVAVSLVVGMTRPLLGVHWPSDVIGGWAFGIGWVTALTTLAQQQHHIVGGHRTALDQG